MNTVYSLVARTIIAVAMAYFFGYVIMRQKGRWRGVLIFLALTFVVSWTIDIALRPYALFQLRGALIMLVPALMAWLVRGPLLKEGFADSGIHFHLRGAWRVYAIAYIVIPIVMICGFAISTLVGLQHWGIQSLSVVLASFGADNLRAGTAGVSRLPLGAVLAWAIGSLSVLLPMNMIFTFGEEYGWRGYLLVKLASLGRTKAALLVGVIWGFWHAPFIAFDNYVYPGHPVAGIFVMVVLTTSLSVILSWLRFASGSIWPGVLAHAAFNAQGELAYVALSPANSLLRPPAGVCTLIPLVAVAAWLIVTKRLEGDAMTNSSSSCTSPRPRSRASG